MKQEKEGILQRMHVKGLGNHAQGMIDPILVEERPKKFGLGYVQFYGENSTTMKALEIVQIRNLLQVQTHKNFKFVFKLNAIF